MCSQEGNLVFLDDEHNPHDYYDSHEAVAHYFNNAEKYSQYQVREWRDMTEKEKTLGHGGMDYLMFKAFFKAILDGKEFALDVYDAASWMCITALSEISIKEGGAPQEIPDFTRGRWKTRARLDVTDFPIVVREK